MKKLKDRVEELADLSEGYLRALGFNSRQIRILRLRIEGFKLREIGEVVGVTPERVRQSLVTTTRKVHRVRKKIEKHQPLTPHERRMAQCQRAYNGSHSAVSAAVCTGVLKHPDRCSRCEEPVGVVAHHNSYAHPLEVQWLCPQCHAVRHKEMAEQGLTGFEYLPPLPPPPLRWWEEKGPSRLFATHGPALRHVNQWIQGR